MHPLDGSRAKIERAREHVSELFNGVRDFTELAPFKVRAAVDEGANEVVFTAEADPEFSPVPIALVLIAGEVAHQLRSALDHLVWQLVLANTGQPPQGTKSGFPIFRTEQGYDQRSPAMIQGVSANASTRIRAAQPFHAGANAESTLTWVVHELNNTDKHRVIPATTTYSFVGHVRMRKGDGSTEDIVAPTEEVGEHLEDGMEIARVTIPPGVGPIEFDLRLGMDIAFQQVGAVQGQPATSLLVETTDYVSNLVESFDVEFA
jgi:hypothetical protein